MRVGVLLVLVAGCGRIAFDRTGDGVDPTGDGGGGDSNGGSDGMNTALLTVDPMTIGTTLLMRQAVGTTEDDTQATNAFGGVRTLGINVSAESGTPSTLTVDTGAMQLVYTHGAIAGSFYARYDAGTNGVMGSLPPTSNVRIRLGMTTASTTISLTLADAVNTGAYNRVATVAGDVDFDPTNAAFAAVDLANLTRIDVEFVTSGLGATVFAGPFTIIP